MVEKYLPKQGTHPDDLDDCFKHLCGSIFAERTTKLGLCEFDETFINELKRID